MCWIFFTQSYGLILYLFEQTQLDKKYFLFMWIDIYLQEREFVVVTTTAAILTIMATVACIAW